MLITKVGPATRPPTSPPRISFKQQTINAASGPYINNTATTWAWVIYESSGGVVYTDTTVYSGSGTSSTYSLLGTGNVLNSNNCEISICETRIKKKPIIFSAIDNLVKGASGQAIQNMNLLFNFSEHLGLK